MIERIKLKMRATIHSIIYRKYYKNIILRGIPDVLYPEKIVFGKNVVLNDNVFLHAAHGIEIGDNSVISYGAALISESFDVSSFEKYKNQCHFGTKIKIGSNVWIGAKAIVLSGVIISNNIVVGAGSVVTKDLTEEYGIYAGNPARLVRKFGE